MNINTTPAVFTTKEQHKYISICPNRSNQAKRCASAQFVAVLSAERVCARAAVRPENEPFFLGSTAQAVKVRPNYEVEVKKFAVAEGKHAKFRCLVTGKPKPEIVWKKDGIPLEPGRRHLMFEDREGYYTLKVLYCKREDTGLYVCAASNALGNTLSAVHLSVKGPSVRFRRQLKDVVVAERDVAVLECEVPDESLPAAWYLEDQRLMPNQKYGMEQKGTRRRLTIRDVETDDDGVYLCEMPDGAKSIAELSVKGPIVRKLPRKLEVLEGENAAFCVEVDQDDMEVHWFKDGLKQHETHQTILKSFGKTHILVFVNVSYQDSGVVTFVAGRSTTTSRLKVKTTRHLPPICPINIKMDDDRPNSALLTWSASPNSQTSTRSMFVVERQEVGSQEWHKCFSSETATSAEVSGDSVPEEGDYRFRVCCINKYGRSGHVEFPRAVHLVPGPKILSRLQACEVFEGEAAHFSMELSTSMLGTWFFNSSQLQNGGRYAVQHSQTRHTLVIHETRAAEDGAEITFIANGVRDSALLQVKPAVLTFSPLSASDSLKLVQAGDAIVLYCEVSHPFAKVSWFKDGDELRVTDGLNIQSDGTMRRIVVHEAEACHSGVYTCRTEHDAVEFKVDVTGPPVEFSPVPEEDLHKSSMELDPVVLVCHVSREDAEVLWLKDGSEIQAGEHITLQAEGTMRRLIIRSAQASDAGAYVCQSGSSSMEFTVSVREPPVMIVEPKDDLVIDSYLGEDVQLQCELSRSGGRVRWSKDGLDVEESPQVQLVSEGPYRRLVLLSCTTEHSGEYVCESDGDSVFFQLNVTEPPVRFVFPTDSELEVTHMAAQRLDLCCEVSKPDAPVVWYKDGLEVEEGPNLSLEVGGAKRTLVIPVPTAEDTGEYVCDTEDDSVAFLVTITEAAVVLSRPKNLPETLKCCTDQALVLEVEVSRPNADVTWLVDGQKIQENQNVSISADGLIRRLTVHCPSVSDSGTYTCDAVDDLMHFQVKVCEPPVKILCKSSINTGVSSTLGDDVELECELSRANALTKWYKNGERLDDSGEYLLDAGDDAISFQVTVQEPPVRIIGNSCDVDYQEMVAGDELILACEVSRPNAPVQWLFNDKPLTPDSRVYIESYGTLRKIIISDVQPSDSGKYVCDAKDDRMVSVVRVQESPVTFLNKEEDVVLVGYEAESLTLSCFVSRQNAQVRWLKDWTPVEGERFKCLTDGFKRTLSIEPLRRSDAGEYTCDANTDQSHFSLLVKEMRVKFTRPLQDTVAHADGMVTLRCEVGKPKADVQWLRGGQEIVPSRRYTIRAEGVERSLTIHRLTRDDAGEYACESKDDRTAAVLAVHMPRVVEFLTELHNTTVLEGEDATFKLRSDHCGGRGKVSKASLKVQEAQIMFTKRTDSVMAEEFQDATLETHISLETGEVQWMRQGVVIQPGPRYTLTQTGCTRSLTIHNLSLSDRGTYRCETLHDRTQVKLNVEPRKITIRKPLLDQEVFEREAASFELELSHTDVEGTWQKDGIRVKPNNQFMVSRNRTSARPDAVPPEPGGHRHHRVLCGGSEDVRQAHGQRSVMCPTETPVSVLQPLSDARVEEDFPVTLECEFSRQMLEVKWYKNGKELKPGKNCRIYSMGRKRFCQILQSSRADSGLYKCDSGEVCTCCSLDVYEHKLELVQELEDLDIQEEQNAVFMCELSLEDVSAEWYKDGQRIRGSSTTKIRTEGTKHFLLICNVKPEDAGEIRFVARDVESVAYLEVEELPVTIVRPLRDRTALEKHRVILECTLSSPRCSAVWYKGSDELVSSDRLQILSDGCTHKLLIQEAAPEDEGTYSVRVGEHTSTAKLLVEGNPGEEGGAEVQKEEGVRPTSLEQQHLKQLHSPRGEWDRGQRPDRTKEKPCVFMPVFSSVSYLCCRSGSGGAAGAGGRGGHRRSDGLFPVRGVCGHKQVSGLDPERDVLQPGPGVRLESHRTLHKLYLNQLGTHMNGTVRFTLGKAKSSASLSVIQD
ncbi:hypothetical protein WMY93_025178 [Mugilogobius chulae]|uniref:Obscurin-like protein 1 n=1 Tax=Mugilogobius chulae TaxID=88201 RepID=A0AAW0N4X1_9GOBI